MDRTTFREQTEYALARVRDIVRLRPMELAEVLVPESSPGERGWELSRYLLDAIDCLRPTEDEVPDSWPRQRYALLSLRYVNGMPVDQAAAHLGLSRRHFYRLLHQALDDFSDMLWARRADMTETSSSPHVAKARTERSTLLESEMAVAADGTENAHVGQVLETVIQTLEPLRRQSEVDITCQACEELLQVPTSSEVLRQIILGLVGDLLKKGCASRVDLEAARNETWVEVTLTASMPSGSIDKSEQPPLSTMYEEMASLQGILLETSPEDTIGSIRYKLRIPSSVGRTVLVVDDNEEVCQLFRLYLASAGYEPLVVENSQQVIAFAEHNSVFAVTLDLMMAHEDGWDMLQQIRHHPSTQSIPVIVCSVLDQRELAMMLGAADFVKKPVMRDALVNALASLTKASPPIQQVP